MTPHDVPTMAQLVEAVREWMERDLLPGTTGRLQFHARVALNMLSTVERELELGPQQAADHGVRLAVLGVADDAELAAGIRSGRFDDRLDEVRALVHETVLDKVRVANPKYLEQP